MKNTNRKKIFLGILIVLAIAAVVIGATYAFFSASVTSDEGDISGSTYQFSMTLAVSRIDPATTPIKGNKLIPLNESDISTAVNSGCVDKNGYSVCQIYQLTFQNNGSGTVTMSGNMTSIQNDFDNLYYNVTTIGGNKNTIAAGKIINKSTPVTDGFTNLVIPKGTSTMYLMLYIKNDKVNDQPNDQDKIFVGTISLTDVTSSAGKIQATFTTGG